MNILIRQAKIISPGSEFNNKIADILIGEGTIVSIRKSITAKENTRIIEGEGLMVSPGWVDMQAVSGDPGFEHRETLASLIRSAAAGGFTAVCIHSHNQPPLHNKTQIEYILNKSRGSYVDILPCGTITVGGKGEDLSEMFDMKQSGAIAFSDYKHPVRDSGMMLRALQYSDNIGSLVIAHNNDEDISRGGQMNEGEMSTSLGLKGIPGLAEELMLQRNLSVLEYSGGRLHVPTVSTKASADMIRKAKAAGLPVTCGVAAVNLLLDDSSVKDFDANYKLDPPLRSRKDVLALRNAVMNGTIDVIVSDHSPHDPESKELEFDYADPGMISLQTTFSFAYEALQEKGIERLISSLALRPREILGLKPVTVSEKAPANLTVFTLDENTRLDKKSNLSLSENSAFFEKDLAGRVLGIVNGNQSYFNS